MSEPSDCPQNPTYCNVTAQALELDPAGYAVSFRQVTFIETPLPWRRSIYTEAGQLPQEFLDLWALWRQRYQETGIYDNRLLLVAPDDAYAEAGHRRVMHFSSPPGPFAHFVRQEYLVPEAQTGALLWNLYEAPEALPQFERYRVPSPAGSRDLLVCTHGTVDVACAKFGYPLYRYLRQDFAGQAGHRDLRVWRVSHFGGHVFAPTLIDMPIGHSWAYVDQDQATRILLRDGQVSQLRGHYRGWAGLEESFAQVAECEMWQKQGWRWCSYAKRAEIRHQDPGPEPQWAEVDICCQLPGGTEQSYRFRVEVAGAVATVPSTGYAKAYSYPQYKASLLSPDASP